MLVHVPWSLNGRVLELLLLTLTDRSPLSWRSRSGKCLSNISTVVKNGDVEGFQWFECWLTLLIHFSIWTVFSGSSCFLLSSDNSFKRATICLSIFYCCVVISLFHGITSKPSLYFFNLLNSVTWLSNLLLLYEIFLKSILFVHKLKKTPNRRFPKEKLYWSMLHTKSKCKLLTYTRCGVINKWKRKTLALNWYVFVTKLLSRIRQSWFFIVVLSWWNCDFCTIDNKEEVNKPSNW